MTSLSSGSSERAKPTLIQRGLALVWVYVLLWRFALGGNPLGFYPKPVAFRAMWEARLKLLLVHAVILLAVLTLFALRVLLGAL